MLDTFLLEIISFWISRRTTCITKSNAFLWRSFKLGTQIVRWVLFAELYQTIERNYVDSYSQNLSNFFVAVLRMILLNLFKTNQVFEIYKIIGLNQRLNGLVVYKQCFEVSMLKYVSDALVA